MNMLNPIALILMKDLSINAHQLGLLSSMYFYGGFLILFPAGLLLDRFSTKKLMLMAMLLAIISVFLFAISTNLFLLYLSRLASGVAAAFAFLGAINLATQWFETRQMAFVTGYIVSIAMLGGIFAQTPMAILEALLGWRQAMMLFGLLGLFFLILIWSYLRNTPANIEIEKTKQTGSKIKSLTLMKQIKIVILNKYNWFSGLYVALMAIPFYLLGALWGTAYLTQIFKISNIQASTVISMLFLGLLIGSPIVGLTSDWLKRRVYLMRVGAIVSLALIILVMYSSDLSSSLLMILFFILGFSASSQILSYTVITEANSPLVTSSALSISSLLLMISGFVSQPLFGWLIGLRWDHSMINNIPIYSRSNYQTALWIILAGFILSIIFTFFIKETYGKRNITESP